MAAPTRCARRRDVARLTDLLDDTCFDEIVPRAPQTAECPGSAGSIPQETDTRDEEVTLPVLFEIAGAPGMRTS